MRRAHVGGERGHLSCGGVMLAGRRDTIWPARHDLAGVCVPACTVRASLPGTVVVRVAPNRVIIACRCAESRRHRVVTS
eukprot:6026800-Prymnesium_polylepis.2